MSAETAVARPGTESAPNPLRRALGHMATSVTLVTTNVTGEPPTASPPTASPAVSVTPPLVAVFLAETAESYPAFARTDHVAVNILADATRVSVAWHFATKGIDKFSAVTLHDRATAMCPSSPAPRPRSSARCTNAGPSATTS